MDNTYIEELAAAYALGALDEQQKEEVENRLAAGDESLQEAIHQYGNTASQLLFAPETKYPRSGFKERLFSQIQSEPIAHAAATPNPLLFRKANEGSWELVEKGVHKKILYKDKARKTTTLLLRMEPGSVLTAHSHDGPEELYVLEGHCNCAGEPMGPGDYHRAEAHSDHIDTTTENGCLMLVISAGGGGN